MRPPLYKGGCLCGSIRFEASREPVNPHSCSCEICRRQSGAATLFWVEFPRDAVAWTGPGGKPALYRSSDFSRRAFCPACGSTLGAVDDAPVVALAIGSFDDIGSSALRPLSHSFADGCPGWARIGGMNDEA